MQTLILCGGMGTRAYPYTHQMPKALMPVNGQPILAHVMQIYCLYGHTDFVLSLGHLKEPIIEHFRAPEYAHLNIEFVDTGETTDTGGRVKGCEHLLDDTFFATYCDGLGDVDLDMLLQHHRHCVQDKGGLATVTAANLRSQYGILVTNSDSQVTGFQEKPILPYWINGGFFVFEKRVFECWEGDNLERDVLPHLASKGALYSYRHTGFWKSMDTYKDQQQMNVVWQPVLGQLMSNHPANAAFVL